MYSGQEKIQKEGLVFSKHIYEKKNIKLFRKILSVTLE
jgi:hypothetical protein